MRARGQTLVASLIVLVIIALLAVVLLKGGLGGTPGANGESIRPDGKGKTIPGMVMATSRDSACRSNLGQARAAIQIAMSDADETPPASLQDLRLGAEFLRCPLGKEPYAYDAASGKVACPHPGHEKY